MTPLTFRLCRLSSISTLSTGTPTLNNGFPHARNEGGYGILGDPIPTVYGYIVCMLWWAFPSRLYNLYWHKIARRVQNVRNWSSLPLVCWRMSSILCYTREGLLRMCSDLDHLRGFHYFCFGNCSLVARLRSRLIAVNMLYCSTSLPELLYDNKGLARPYPSCWCRKADIV